MTRRSQPESPEACPGTGAAHPHAGLPGAYPAITHADVLRVQADIQGCLRAAAGHSARGQASSREGQHVEAIEAYAEALRVQPFDAVTRLRFAIEHHWAGQSEAAAEMLAEEVGRLAARKVADVEEIRRQARLEDAHEEDDAGGEGCRQILLEFITRYHEIQAREWLGVILYSLGLLLAARKQLERALQLAEKNPICARQEQRRLIEWLSSVHSEIQARGRQEEPGPES